MTPACSTAHPHADRLLCCAVVLSRCAVWVLAVPRLQSNSAARRAALRRRCQPAASNAPTEELLCGEQ